MNDRADFDSLVPEVKFSRRGFIASSVATGFALAAQPISAQTVITTSADGLDAGMAMVPSGGAQLPVYYAAPKKAGKYPVILVVQEIFGLHEHIKDVARRFAKAGYFAIAPDLYFRTGDATKIADIPTLQREIVSKATDAQVMGDLDACVAWAGSQKAAAANRVGVTGFCWGGRITWLYVAHNPKVKAGVAWYGRLVGDPTPANPSHPINVTDKITRPVLGLYGGADQGIPVVTVERMREGLKAFGNPGEIVVYPDAPHAFHADYRPSYRKAAADDGWKRATAWFRKYV